MKFKLLLFAIVINCYFNIGLFPQTFSGGDGSENDPYLISNFTDIEELTNLVNVGYPQGNVVWSNVKYFILTQDIINDSVKVPIGRYFPSGGANLMGSFEGYFDGNGHKIALGINHSLMHQPAGLFGAIRNATIINVKVVGYVNSSVEIFGAIVGSSINSVIKNCVNYASVTAIGTAAGGIVGECSDNSIIENCTNIGAITSIGIGNSYTPIGMGGIAFAVSSGAIMTNCLNIGSILNNRTAFCLHYRIGGLAGVLNVGTITNSINAGFISSNVENVVPYEQGNGVGGIAGITGTTGVGSVMTNCINTGVVEGPVGTTGAITNIRYTNSTIANCHYDKQFCIHKGVNGQDVSGVSPHLTRNMVGRKLANLLGDNDWTYVEGATLIQSLYPQLKVLDHTDASKVGASPIYLYDGIKD